MALKSKFIRAGSWRNLEWSWNARFTCRFVLPVGAQVRANYGPGITSQRQTLNGSPKIVRIGGGSIFVGRVQMKVVQDAQVEYEYLAV